MTLLDTWVQTHAAEALGLTLFHSLWEGAIVAMALAIVLRTVRTSVVRHAAACLALIGMLAGFGLTLGCVMQQPVPGSASLTVKIPPAPNGFDEQIRSRTVQHAADLLPWLGPLWILGVFIFHLRSLAAWIATRRLRRTGVCSAPPLWQESLNRLGRRLRNTRPVELLESCLADVPMVVGYVRPVILLPVGLLTGLPARQIESILLHELAHIRRHDYLVNLLQTLVEGLFFYHPAVWWISGVIRTEREECCDDMVVAITGDAQEYAIALATLEQNRWSAREAALAATGGTLVKRIRRLLYRPETPGAAWTPVVSAGILTITAALALVAWQSTAEKPQRAPYSKWVNEDVVYIVTDQERAAFQGLQTDEERKEFIEQFWKRRDPTPDTPENEFKEEHYRRIAYANDRFSTADTPGWKTDRGRIYIRFGPPDEIEAHLKGGHYTRPHGVEVTTSSFQQWRYHLIKGVGDNVIIEFVDKTSSGDWRMTTDPHAKEVAP